MNIQSMAKQMTDVDRFAPGVEYVRDADSYAGVMDRSDSGFYVRYTDYAAIQQQLAAAREAMKSLERETRAWRNRFIDERMRAYEGKGYEMARCYAESDANEFIEAFHATLQRDRQP